MADYDYMLGGTNEDGSIPFFEPDTEISKAHIEWIRGHGISPDWCFGIRLEGDQAVLRLARWVETSSGTLARELVRDEDIGGSVPTFDEHTVPREGFPEVPAREVIRQLSEDNAALGKQAGKAGRTLDRIWAQIDTHYRK